jgi:glycosyltransferase involved in cell wall biosynthesis
MLRRTLRWPGPGRRWPGADGPAPQEGDIEHHVRRAPIGSSTGFPVNSAHVPAREAPDGRSAVIIPGYPGQPSGAELARQAALGTRPRRDYVEVARALDADIIDPCYMAEQASPVGRVLASRAGILAGELYEAYAARNRFEHICAWADRAGLPLALMYKLTRSRSDLTMVSVYLSSGKKALFLRNLGVQSHLGAIVNFSSLQTEIAAQRLNVPPGKLHHVPHPVDERFWHPAGAPPGDRICSAGWEARDYGTLVNAVSGLQVRTEIAIGIQGFSSSAMETDGHGDSQPRRFETISGKFTQPLYQKWRAEVLREGVPPNVSIHNQLSPRALRDLYSRSRFVVVPLHEADFDAGVTALCEAMAMGKAVIITQTRGQADVVREGVNGLYVPPGDPRALRQAIEHLLGHPEEAARMGRAGRELAETRHALDRYVERVARIVRSSGKPCPQGSRAGLLARQSSSITPM